MMYSGILIFQQNKQTKTTVDLICPRAVIILKEEKVNMYLQLMNCMIGLLFQFPPCFVENFIVNSVFISSYGITSKKNTFYLLQTITMSLFIVKITVEFETQIQNRKCVSCNSNLKF